MKYRYVLAVLCIAGVAYGASVEFGQYMSTLPSASVPPNDADTMLVLQGGGAKKIQIGDVVRASNASIAYRNISGVYNPNGANIRGISLSQTTGDTTHRTVTDAEKSTWNGKQSALANYTTLAKIGAGGNGGIAIPDIVVKGPWVDNRAFSNLSTAKVYAEQVGKPLHVHSSVTANNLTINGSVKVFQGGSISVASGKTLTINGPFEAGQYATFTGPGSLKLPKGAVCYVEWFGGLPDTATSDWTSSITNTAAVQAAINAVTTNGGTIRVPRMFCIGTTGTTIITLKDNVTIDGTNTGGFIIADSVRTHNSSRNFLHFYANTFNNGAIVNTTFDGNAANNLAQNASGWSMITLTVAGNSNNILIDNNRFINQPGRNIISAGWNGYNTNVKITRNLFQEVGGSITGNSVQNDHSSIYTIGKGVVIANNVFRNTTAWSCIGRQVTAIETHDDDAVVSNNEIENYSVGIIQAAAEIDITDGVAISINKISVLRAGITLEPAPASTKLQQNITMDGNNILLIGTSSTTSTFDAIYVRRVKNVSITGGSISNAYPHGLTSTAIGVHVMDNVENISVTGVSIKGLWAYPMLIEQLNTGTFQRKITFTHNTISAGIINAGIRVVTTYYPVSNVEADYNTIVQDSANSNVTDDAAYGIRLQLTQPIYNSSFNYNIIRVPNGSQRYSVSDATKIFNVANNPLVHTITRAGTIYGIFSPGMDIVYYSDPIAGGYIGKIPTVTNGVIHNGAWTAATAYPVGYYAKTSTNKYIECVVAGTSDASTEPNPSTPNGLFTDGMAQWRYRSLSAQVWKDFGAILP